LRRAAISRVMSVEQRTFGMTALPRRLVVLALMLAAPLAACGTAPAQAHSGPESFAPIVRRVLPAVVNIAVTEQAAPDDDPLANLPPALQRQFRDQMRHRQMQGAGSGFIIDPSGYVVTNNHVVANADRIVVTLSDGTDLRAEVVGVDELTDVALLRVNAHRPLPFVAFGDSHSVAVGDWVVAAGNPFGLGGSITAGIVSARGRDIGEGPFDDFIQIDAPINPGNSGGPVFDEDGNVVGMNTAIVSPTGGSVGIGFAIPAEIVSRIVGDLRSGGQVERGWLGVGVTQDAPPGGGVGVDSVDRAGPAARAGLRPGDVVTAVDETGVDSANALIKAVAALPPGRRVSLTLRRGDRSLTIRVTIGRRPVEGAG
jgi:serine protease Do